MPNGAESAASKDTQELQPVWYLRFRRAALINGTISALWTLIMILPFPPFPIFLRIIVGGGPGTWFMLSYILYIAVGFGGFLGLSFLYFAVESERKIHQRLAWLNLLAMYVGVTGAVLTLAAAGALGGYASTIVHSPPETVRLILEPFVDVIRVLCLVAFIGVISGLVAIYPSKKM